MNGAKIVSLRRVGSLTLSVPPSCYSAGTPKRQFLREPTLFGVPMDDNSPFPCDSSVRPRELGSKRRILEVGIFFLYGLSAGWDVGETEEAFSVF